MKLIAWDKLPPKMQNNEVRPYYDAIKGKNCELIVKRFFDVVGALLLIILTSPVLLIIAAWIKRDSPGPVLFRQIRVTQFGKEFTVLKYRTMVDHAEKIGSQITGSDDKRITEVGKKIRDKRLDELPQLFNILAGDMTFVGTRPEVPKYVEHYDNEMLATLLLPAGVTSKASLQFRNEHEILADYDDIDSAYIQKVLPIKMKDNLDALSQFSLWNDLRILIKTVEVVLGK